MLQYSQKGYSRDGISALTTISFPAFSGLLATFIAAAAAAPDEIPTCTIFTHLHMATRILSFIFIFFKRKNYDALNCRSNKITEHGIS